MALEYSTAELAKLGIVVDATGVLKASSDLNTLTASGKKAEQQMVGGTVPAVNRVGTEAAKTSAKMNMLRSTMVPLASQMAGLNPMVGRLASTLGLFALSSGVMVGVLAGLAAVGFAWDKLTQKAREAKEATEGALSALRELARQQGLGPGGETAGQVIQARERRYALLGERSQINASIARTPGGGLSGIADDPLAARRALQDKRLGEIATELRDVERLIQAGETRINSIYREMGEDAAATARRYGDEQARIAKAAADERIRIAEEMARKLEGLDNQFQRRFRFGLAGTPNASGVPLTQEGLSRFREDQITQGQFLRGGTTLSKVAPAGGFRSFGRRQADMVAEAKGSYGDNLLSGLRSQIVGLATTFGPLAAAAAVLKPVFEGLMEALGPMLEKLAEPLAQIGRIVGGILVPVLEVLEKPLQILANLVALLLEPLRLSAQLFASSLAPGLKLMGNVLGVVTKGFSYILEAIGWFVTGLGKFIDKIVPDWISTIGKGLADMGREMQANAKAAREGTLAMEKGAKAVDQLTRSLANVPGVLPIDLYRYRYGRGSGGLGGGGGVVGGGGGVMPPAPPRPPIVDDNGLPIPEPIQGKPVVIYWNGDLNSNATNGKQLLDDLRREAIKDIRSGGIGLQGAIPA